MKFLKYLLYFFLFLLIAFFAIGLLYPDIKYGHTITVDKPVKEAWAVHQDHTKFPEWLRGFKSIEHLDGEVGTVGSTYKVIVDPGEGQEDFEMIETIVSKKEFDHITFHFDSEMMEFDQTTTFEETAGKTTIQTQSEVQVKGFFMRSMFALMDLLSDSFRKQEELNINALKRVINDNTTNYYPTPPVVDSIGIVDQAATLE